MYLQRLTVRGFRKLRDVSIHFGPGLNLIVGENNAGKTAIIDAIRLLLSQGFDKDRLRVTAEDFRSDQDEKPKIHIAAEFVDLDLDDEAYFSQAIHDWSGDASAVFQIELVYDTSLDRISGRTWMGPGDTGNSPSKVLDAVSCLYLPPLRDPGRGLRPSYSSQIARLLRHVATAGEKKAIERLAGDRNQAIQDQDAIRKAEGLIADELGKTTGPQMAQSPELVFSEARFDRIAAALFATFDGVGPDRNGLGYNNLGYIAVTMAALRNEPELRYRSVLLEEPEAHLHPQLQTVLLRYMLDLEQAGPRPVQVFGTTHSPVLASGCSLSKISVVRDLPGGEAAAIALSQLGLDPQQVRQIERYLDATKGQLLFARRVVLVEGLSEALLLGPLATAAGWDLRDRGATIVNVQGLSFEPFLRLLGSDGLGIPTLVVTDSDPPTDDYPERKDYSSAGRRAKALIGRQSSLLGIACAVKTFEYDLALESENLPLMWDALCRLNRARVRRAEGERGATEEGRVQLARAWFDAAFTQPGTRVSKPELAQLLAEIAEQEGQTIVCPEYLATALAQFFGTGEPGGPGTSQ